MTIMTTDEQFTMIREKEDEEALLGVDTRKEDAPSYQAQAKRWQLIEDIPHFVPAFEGLRGVAVLMTQWTHIGMSPSLIYLGPGGVAVFFCLSGFLITGVLLKHQTKSARQGKPFGHLARFYCDRAVRLYPALITMVCVMLAYQYYWTNGQMGPQAVQEGLLALTYLVDVRFLFVEESIPSAFSNIWSLSVEEKFYLFFSIALPVIARMSGRIKKWTMLTLICASLACHFYWYFTNPFIGTVLFGQYAPCQHIWKLLIGASLRLFATPSFFKSRWATWAGLTLIVAPFYLNKLFGTIDTTSWSFPPRNDLTYEILWAPTAVLGTVFVICGALHHGNWLLECHPLRFVGRISYAWYCYQLPLLRLVNPFGNWHHGFFGLGITSIAFIFALCSTFYIEEPIRNAYKKWRSKPSSQAATSM